MKIHFFAEDISLPKFKKTFVRDIISFISSNENTLIKECNVIFCSDTYLLNINKQYLNHDYYTDVITFEYPDNEFKNTDIYISVDRVLDNSIQLSQDFQKELFRVIIHGILHICNYKDNTEASKIIMTNRENFYLQKFLL